MNTPIAQAPNPPPRLFGPSPAGRRPITSSPLALAADAGKLFREYQALVASLTLTNEDVTRCYVNGAALAGIFSIWLALKLAGWGFASCHSFHASLTRFQLSIKVAAIPKLPVGLRRPRLCLEPRPAAAQIPGEQSTGL